MRVTVRLFAVLRERAGMDQMDLDLLPGTSVQAATAMVGELVPSIRELLPRVATAVNRSYMNSETVLEEGDELALIPPVSGG